MRHSIIKSFEPREECDYATDDHSSSPLSDRNYNAGYRVVGSYFTRCYLSFIFGWFLNR